MGWTTPVSPSIGQKVSDGSGGTFDWDVQIRDNFLAVQRVLDKDVSQQEVVSTTTETTVYTVSVAGGTLGTGAALRLTAHLDFLNNTGGNSTPAVRVKFGGSSLLAHTPTIATNANRRLVKVEATIMAGNATNVQRFDGTSVFTTAGANGNTLTEDNRTWMRHDSLSFDSTGALTLAITVQHDASSASLSFKCQYVVLEYLPS